MIATNVAAGANFARCALRGRWSGMRAFSRYREAPSGEPQKWALLALLGCACATLTIAFSDAFGNMADQLPVGGLLLLPPLFSPALLLAYLAFSK
jgi:hypothetical protein